MVARLLPAAHVPVDAGAHQPSRRRRVEQQVIDAQPGVAPVGIAKVIPVGVDRLVGMHRPQGIGPPLPGEACKGLTHLDPEQGVVDPALGLVHVALGRDDVVIAREDHRRLGGNELCGVSEQPLEPAQLVVELRARCGIAVGQIEAGDVDAVDLRLDVAAVGIVRIAGKRAADLGRLRIAGQDRDPVPALLTAPDRSVPGVPDRAVGKALLRRLQLLQANDLGRGLREPAQKTRQTCADAVDVVGDDPHLALTPRGGVTAGALALDRPLARNAPPGRRQSAGPRPGTGSRTSSWRRPTRCCPSDRKEGRPRPHRPRRG